MTEDRVDIKAIIDAKRPEEVFGQLPDDVTTRMDAVKSTYRILLRAVHPDKQGGSTEAAAKLNALYALAVKQIEEGTYGTTRASVVDDVVINTTLGTHTIDRGLGAGHVCKIFGGFFHQPEQGDYDTGAEFETIIKVATRHEDTDLLTHEFAIVEKVRSFAEQMDADYQEDEEKFFANYVPNPVESFRIRQPNKPIVQANAFVKDPKRLYSLAEVKSEYPAPSLHVKDMAWMFRRLLMALGIAHKAGVVHGAVLPEHVLIQPDTHGLVLVDWKYAAEAGDHIKAIPGPYRAWYPDEVLNKEKASPATDIYMGVRCMIHLLGGGAVSNNLPDTIPMPMRAFFRGCLKKTVTARPQDAWDLLEDFDAVLERLYGPRRFRPFYMPS